MRGELVDTTMRAGPDTDRVRQSYGGIINSGKAFDRTYLYSVTDCARDLGHPYGSIRDRRTQLGRARRMPLEGRVPKIVTRCLAPGPPSISRLPPPPGLSALHIRGLVDIHPVTCSLGACGDQGIDHVQSDLPGRLQIMHAAIVHH